jgi:hypothetical protein
MENLFSKIQLPLFAIVLLLIIIATMQASTAYNNYWQGKLARIQYEKESQLSVLTTGKSV